LDLAEQQIGIPNGPTDTNIDQSSIGAGALIQKKKKTLSPYASKLKFLEKKRHRDKSKIRKTKN
jgi:hypothetical protein